MSNSTGVSRASRVSFRRPHRQAEPLDRRVLLATAFVVDGVLEVSGTDAGETIRITAISEAGTVDVVVDGTTIFSPRRASFGPIKIDGRGGNDDIAVGLDLPCTLIGGSGNDTIAGTGTTDTIEGGPGDDSLSGGSSYDSIEGGEGRDTLRGDAGWDSLRGGPGNDHIDGGTGNDTLFGGAGNDALFGQAGDDGLVPGSGVDSLYGGSGADFASYFKFEDEASSDLVRNAPLRLSLDGIANDGELGATTGFVGGVESIVCGEGNDCVVGSKADEVITGYAGRDSIFGQGGNDRLEGGMDEDLLEGGSGDDFLDGGVDADVIIGAGGDDSFRDEGSAGTVIGGAGVDSVSFSGYGANDGSMVFSGGPGDDSIALTGLRGSVQVSGGGGSDYFEFFDFLGNGDSSITLDGVANDSLPGARDDGNVLPDIERFRLSGSNDFFDGSMMSRRIEVDGNGGNDTLIGGSGSDKLRGGFGNDSIIGNGGTDFINGGWGNDFIDSADGAFDLVNGSSGGSDRAERDAGIDDVSNVELFA